MIFTGMSITTGGAGRWFGMGNTLFPDHDAYPIPTPDERDLGDALRGAEALHERGRIMLDSLSTFSSVPGDFERTFSGQDPARWIEIAQLVRSAGEAAEMVIASMCETAGLLEATDPHRPTSSPLLSAFTTEAALQYLMSVGHSLTNAAFRVCAASPSCASRLGNGSSLMRQRVRAAAPRSQDRRGWLFHSSAAQVADALGSSATPQARLMRVPARLHRAKAWRRANESRDEYFHRWRHGFSGGGQGAYSAAVTLHAATEEATKCMGRALPAFYHYLQDSLPVARSGGSRGAPLVSMVWSQSLRLGPSGSPEAVGSPEMALPRTSFRG